MLPAATEVAGDFCYVAIAPLGVRLQAVFDNGSQIAIDFGIQPAYGREGRGQHVLAVLAKPLVDIR